MSDAFDPQPTVVNEPLPDHLRRGHRHPHPHHRARHVAELRGAGLAAAEALAARHARAGAGRACCSSSRSSPTSSRRWIPRRRTSPSRRPTRSASTSPTRAGDLAAAWSFPTVETDELDPVTFQPLIGPDYDEPAPARLLREGLPLQALRLIPADRHFFGALDGTPVHFLGTDKFGRDILSRGIVGSQISLTIALISIALITIIGTLVGIASGYIGGRFDIWLQRFVEIVLAFPQLPLYLALTTLIPVTAPSNVFLTFVILVIVGARLGAARRARCAARRWRSPASTTSAPRWRSAPADWRIIIQHILPNVMSHVIVAMTLAHPDDRAARKLPRLPRLRGEAAADLLGPDAAGRRRPSR